jgi:hypothetical protein
MQSTHKLLKKLDSLLEAFHRHYEAVQTSNTIAQMIQRDNWRHFQIEVANARQAIRIELEKEAK